MEFHEKLQELRKNRGLTQEELAQALFVSRTAVSKWESGRGYPSIISLKEISEYFSVTIDDLLSSEKLVSIAKKENRANIRNICDMFYGIADLFSVITNPFSTPEKGFFITRKKNPLNYPEKISFFTDFRLIITQCCCIFLQFCYQQSKNKDFICTQF